MTLFFLLVIALAAFGAGYAFAVSRARRRLSRAPEVVLPASATAHGAPEPEVTRVTFARDAEEGSLAWRAAMAEAGDAMRRSRVRLVVFVHGSFVGDDPLAIARSLEGAVPALGAQARALRGFTRAQVHRLLGDLSNFTPDYVSAFARATGVDATSFTWSGENHHAARVQGAVRLARAIALHGGGALGPGDRVLLAGHSHGGQLFAILSQLVAGSSGHEELVLAARARGEDVAALEEHVAILRRCAIDAVTFGTPPRYGWARGAGFRVLHVVNHRGDAPRARSLLGMLHTREGDYVHQLGVPGSDFPSPRADERAINARLDRLLGEGTGARAWLRHVARGLRVAPLGHTALVDYGDDAGAVPNLLATGLGHAAYTRRDAMLFHVRLISTQFYSATPPALHVRGAAAVRSTLLRVRAWMAARRPLALPPRRLPSTPDG